MPSRIPRQITQALGHFLAYLAWVAGFKLLTLTLITWFLMTSNSKFQEISDVYASNELLIMGLGALLYVGVLRALNPLTSTTTEEIFTPHRFEKRFAPGFAHGALIAVGVTVAFLITDNYRYLGSPLQFEDAPLTLTGVLLRVATVGALAYCEEFIFRHKILHLLRRSMPDAAAALLTATLYCVVKAVQFDLGLMQMATLFLLAASLAMRTMTEGDFVRGAGYWCGLLVVLHPLLGLPALGNEFQGMLLVKYHAPPGSEAVLETTMTRFLTGGAGGPLSSFGLQVLIVFDVAQGLLKNKKTLWGLPAPRATKIK